MKNLILTSSLFRLFKFSFCFILLFCFNAKLKSQTQQRLWYMGDLQFDMHTSTPPAPGSTGAPKGATPGYRLTLCSTDGPISPGLDSIFTIA